ncbi:MAG: hypothetical protein N2489_11430 [Clostridia bacterium]|nr:hypothetical protein [Clostridia bacterium]
MKKKQNIILSLLLAVMITVTVFAGCGKKANETEPTTSAPQKTVASESTIDTSTPYEFTHYVDFDWWNGEKLEEKEYGKYLLEKTNCIVKTSKPPQGATETLQIMLSSNQIPDLITVDCSSPAVGSLIEGGYVQDIGKLIDEFAPDIRKYVEPEYFQYHKWNDGKNYYFSNFIKTKWVQEQEGFSKIDTSTNVHLIRSDIYEAIGKPDMTSPENFFKALMSIKEKYPKIKPYYFGPSIMEDSLFKLSEYQANYFMMTQFGLGKYEVINDKVVSSIRGSKFQEYIKFMNKLYVNGLIDNGSFIDSEEIKKTKYRDGNAAVFSAKLEYWNPVPKDGSKKYDYLPYFADAKATKADSGWTATFISSKVAKPERIMKFIEWCESPKGKADNSYGPEGKCYTLDSNGWPVRSTEWIKKVEADANLLNETGISAYMWFADAYYSLRAYWTDDVIISKEIKNDWKSKYADKFNYEVFLGRMDPPGNTDEGAILARLITHAQTYYPKMILAKDESECMKIYNEFLSTCESGGLEKLEKYWTTKYQQYK